MANVNPKGKHDITHTLTCERRTNDKNEERRVREGKDGEEEWRIETRTGKKGRDEIRREGRQEGERQLRRLVENSGVQRETRGVQRERETRGIWSRLLLVLNLLSCLPKQMNLNSCCSQAVWRARLRRRSHRAVSLGLLSFAL